MEENKENIPVTEQEDASTEVNENTAEEPEKEIVLEKEEPTPVENEKQGEQFDVTQAEFEIYNLVTDLSEIYTELYNLMKQRIDLDNEENQELLYTLADFDTALSITSVLSLEMMNLVRTIFKDDPESIQKVLTAVIQNVNETVDSITDEEIEPMEEMDEVPDETPIIYN